MGNIGLCPLSRSLWYSSENEPRDGQKIITEKDIYSARQSVMDFRLRDTTRYPLDAGAVLGPTLLLSQATLLLSQAYSAAVSVRPTLLLSQAYTVAVSGLHSSCLS